MGWWSAGIIPTAQGLHFGPLAFLHKGNLGLSHFERHTEAILMPESSVYYGNILGDAIDYNTCRVDYLQKTG